MGLGLGGATGWIDDLWPARSFFDAAAALLLPFLERNFGGQLPLFFKVMNQKQFHSATFIEASEAVLLETITEKEIFPA
jgi:hypothetical protein